MNRWLGTEALEAGTPGLDRLLRRGDAYREASLRECNLDFGKKSSDMDEVNRCGSLDFPKPTFLEGCCGKIK